MGLYKEENALLAQLENQQEAIYPGQAADYGIVKDDESWEMFTDLIKQITEMGFNMHRLVEEYSTGRQVKVTFYLPWEYVEGCTDKMVCTKWVVEYVETYNKRGIDKDYFSLYQQNVPVVDEHEVYSERGVHTVTK